MNKKVKIEKEIQFSSMIGEITAIQLEKEINKISANNIEGKLILSGKYKSTSASQIESSFTYDIPIEIAITESLDPNTIEIIINDFYYDVIDNESIKCNIELSIDGDEMLLENRECDGDSIEKKEIEIPHIENIPIEEKNELMEREEITTPEKIETLDNSPLTDNKSFFKIEEEKESYGTFIVYMVRQNETINSILEKYHTSIEELEKYNNIKEISEGSKLIIPYNNETTS